MNPGMIIAKDTVLNREGNLMKYAERVEKAKNFVNKNKLFTIIAVFAVCYLFVNCLFSKVNSDSFDDTEMVQSESSETQEIPDEETTIHWQFYWSDLVILAVAGGFCTIMIIHERKKERDDLQ